jgi:hypothetical protein
MIMSATGTELEQANAGVDLIWRWQRGRCAICGFGWPPVIDTDGKTWFQSHGFVIDHDHRTALVRGWLCRSCNVGEGLRDHGAVARYRESPPATVLGIAVRYWSDWTGFAVPEVVSSRSDPEQSPTYKLMTLLNLSPANATS